MSEEGNSVDDKVIDKALDGLELYDKKTDSNEQKETKKEEVKEEEEPKKEELKKDERITISKEELEQMKLLFNVAPYAIERITKKFDMLDKRVQVTFDDLQIKMIADEDIPKGTKLYVGNCISKFHIGQKYAKSSAKDIYTDWSKQIFNKEEINTSFSTLLSLLFPRKHNFQFEIDDELKRQMLQMQATENDIKAMEELTMLMEKLHRNHFDRNGNFLLFFWGSLFNHSCVPNAFFEERAWEDKDTLTIISHTDIKEGEEITISYIDMLPDDVECRKDMLKGFLFDCVCSSCKDPTLPQPSFIIYQDLVVPNSRFCINCGKGSSDGKGGPGQPFNRCSKCKWAYYCSERCQKKNRKVHKHICEPQKSQQKEEERKKKESTKKEKESEVIVTNSTQEK